MVDPAARKKLAELSRRLVAGRMTNDDFDDVYYDEFLKSHDIAVQQIATTCWSLYSSDLLFPYPLKGRHAVDRKTRRMIARSIVFLRSSREYQWPPLPQSVLFSVLWSLGQISRYCGGILTVFGVAALATTSRDRSFWLQLTVSAAAILAFGIWTWHRHGLAAIVVEPDLRRWQATGDYDVWPFFNREDFYQARRKNHLLGSAT